MNIHLHKNDLSYDIKIGPQGIAIDTEAMGLNHMRDRLCLVQLGNEYGDVHLIQMEPVSHYPRKAPRLEAILKDQNILKLFHFARFDVGILKRAFGMSISPIYCTKIASKLCRTYTDRHSLKDLCHHLLGVTLKKEERESDWGSAVLTKEQQAYAANDVLYLHALKEKLDQMLKREGRMHIAEQCFVSMDTLTTLDQLNFPPETFFSH